MQSFIIGKSACSFIIYDKLLYREALSPKVATNKLKGQNDKIRFFYE